MEKERIKIFKEELNWLEKNPFYIGNDGLPNLKMIFFIIFTGFFPGLIISWSYKRYKMWFLRRKIGDDKK